MNWDVSWIAVHLQYGENIDIWRFTWGRDIYFDIIRDITDNPVKNWKYINSWFKAKFQAKIITNKPKESQADQ